MNYLTSCDGIIGGTGGGLGIAGTASGWTETSPRIGSCPWSCSMSGSESSLTKAGFETDSNRLVDCVAKVLNSDVPIKGGSSGRSWCD